jgi:hypothetical protein
MIKFINQKTQYQIEQNDDNSKRHKKTDKIYNDVGDKVQFGMHKIRLPMQSLVNFLFRYFDFLFDAIVI